jgi:hypothetical protein
VAACCLLIVYRAGEHHHPRIDRTQLAAPKLVLHYPNATLVAWDFGPEDTMVQVIQTRFMQFQPNLAALGEARFNIFETFCLPSILAQSSKQFIWLIRTDPMLDENIRDRLINLLKEYPNILLIASNGNPEGFRLDASVEDITPDRVWSGSYELLRRYHAASQSRVLVESRLDADDGLHFGFVEFAGLLTKEELVSPETDWLVYCAYSHLEWHHANPFQKSVVEETAYGFVVGATQTSCVTAGLSYVYGLQVGRDDMPKGAHSHLHKTVPLCSSSVKSSCLRQMKELIPTAIRARTPTSAGMANVVVAGSDGKDINLEYAPSEDAVTFQDEIWKGVSHSFGIEKAKVAKTRASLVKHLPAIVRDNLKGQCTKGHSCKPGSKNVLKQLLSSLPIAVKK